jgi:hypothetical protein
MAIFNENKNAKAIIMPLKRPLKLISTNRGKEECTNDPKRQK